MKLLRGPALTVNRWHVPAQVSEEALVAAVFYEEGDDASREAMESLEGIDDEAGEFE